MAEFHICDFCGKSLKNLESKDIYKIRVVTEYKERNITSAAYKHEITREICTDCAKKEHDRILKKTLNLDEGCFRRNNERL